MTTAVFVDPSVAGPAMLFSTGTVADGAEQFQPEPAPVGQGSDAGWNVTQWNTPADQIFDAADPILSDTADTDPLLGAAVASWHTGTAADGSAFVVYGPPGDETYRLAASGGSTRDTFLQTTGYAPGTLTFDHQIAFSADERVASADAGDGTAIAFNAFTVFFNRSDTPSYTASLPTLELFLQVPLTDFRGQPGPYQTIAKGNDYQQIYNLSSQSWSPSAATLVSDASVNALAFAADPGGLHTIDIDLNQALLRMTDAMAAQDPANAAAFLDLSRWSLGSTYLGVETGAGTSPGGGSLSIDVAHPVVTQDLSAAFSSDAAPATVQSIDDNRYANIDDTGVITTLPGSTNTITLAGGIGPKTVTSNGTDIVTVGADQTVALHAQGQRLTVIGQSPGFASASLDGAAPIAVSGSFGALTIDNRADDARIAVSVLATAQLSLGGDDAQVSVAGAVNAVLSGRDAVLAAGGGVVALDAGGGRIDLTGGGTQTIFLNGQDAGVTETGFGSQVVVGAATLSGHLQLTGGHGAQMLWTGGATATVTAAAASAPGASLTIAAQAGSSTSLQLGGEQTEIDDQGGAVAVNGGTVAGATVTIHGGSGSVTVAGGAERLVATAGDAGGTLQLQAGSGAQTIFGGRATLEVIGSHDTGGTQLIVNGDDPGDATTIFGGLTRQTIWTGRATDTIVSSTRSGDASGSIQAVIQGGASAYWGGTEQASLDNQAGRLEAFLNGDGRVSILAEMTNSTTILHGFGSDRDSLTLGGITDPSRLHVATAGGSTTLSLDSTGGSVTLLGVSHVGLSMGAGGVLVTG